MHGNVFISVDGSGVPHEAPKMASNMGANSEAFKMAPSQPKIEDSAEYKAQKAKEDAEKKAKEEEEAEKEREEAEKKAKEEEDEQKKREDELKKKQRTQGKNAATSNQVAITAAVLCAMVAAIPFF
jgi:flagellar biosynthesis GTPase FlhF